MSVREAQSRIDSAEFSEWMAYSILEPFGPEREDYRAGVLAALTANINRDPKKRSDPFDPEDFFPTFDGAANAEAARPEPANLESKLVAWAAAMADNDERPKSQLRPKS